MAIQTENISYIKPDNNHKLNQSVILKAERSQGQLFQKQDKVYNGPRDILFNEKSTKNSLTRTHFSIHPLISRYEIYKYFLKISLMLYYYDTKYDSTFL